jgi:hypothetical protein
MRAIIFLIVFFASSGEKFPPLLICDDLMKALFFMPEGSTCENLGNYAHDCWECWGEEYQKGDDILARLEKKFQMSSSFHIKKGKIYLSRALLRILSEIDIQKNGTSSLTLTSGVRTPIDQYRVNRSNPFSLHVFGLAVDIGGDREAIFLVEKELRRKSIEAGFFPSIKIMHEKNHIHLEISGWSIYNIFHKFPECFRPLPSYPLDIFKDTKWVCWESEAPSLPFLGRVEVDTHLNCREFPIVTEKIVTKFEKGKQVKITDYVKNETKGCESGEWGYIEEYGCWVCLQFIIKME